MKKILLFCLALALPVLTVLASCEEDEETNSTTNIVTSNDVYCEGTLSTDYSKYDGITLNIYNWGEYISDGSDDSIDVNEEFTKLTGIEINYTNYASNEDMYAKLKSGGANYDVIIPSDYMIERLVKENMLEKLDFSNIPNAQFIADKYKSLYFDENNEYSIAYTSGMVGIIYNTTMVEGTPDSWSIMWDEKYSGQILNFNNPRDAFGTAQFLLGQDINTTNEADWQAAYEKLVEQKPVLKGYVMDEIFTKMESGEAAISAYYTGDFLTMYGNNEDLAFVYPKEGTNIFVDAMAIPKGAINKEAAELYINFMLDPFISQANAEFICYASPNTEVINNEEYIAYLSELHPDAYKLLYGSDENYKTQYFKNLPSETLEIMNNHWEELKTNGFEGLGLYISAGVIIVLIAAIVITNRIRRHKRERV